MVPIAVNSRSDLSSLVRQTSGLLEWGRRIHTCLEDTWVAFVLVAAFLLSEA